MAEEIGTGYVSLVPSLKGFSKKTERELRRELRGGIEVPIKPVFDPKSLDVDVDPNGRAFRTQLEAMVTRAVRGVHAQVPVEPGDHRGYLARLKAFLFRTRATQHVRVEPDYDRNTLRRLATQTQESGFGLGKILSAGFQGGLMSPFGIAAIVGTIIASLPFIGGIVGMATIAGAGLAALVVGGFLLAGDKQLQDAVKSLFGKIGAGLKSAAAPLKGPFLDAIGIIAESLKAIAPDVKDFFKTIADSGAIQELARGVGGLIKSLVDTGALKALAKAIGPVLSQIGMALPDIGNAISQFILSLTQGGNAQRVADFTGKFFRTVADIIRLLGTVFGFLIRIFPPTLAFLKMLFTPLKTVFTVIGWIIKGGLVLAGVMHQDVFAIQAAFNAFKSLPGDIAALFKWLWRKITGFGSDAVAFLKGLPGRITSAVGNLAKLLVDAGHKVIQGLIDGIRAKLGALSNVAASVAQTIRNFLPFSPAKEGPLSGSGNPFHSGQVIASDLAGGVRSQLPTVRSAAAQLAGQFGIGGPSLAAAGAGPGFTIDTAGSRLDQLLLEVIKESIRDRFGGDVDLAIGKKARR